MTARDTIARVPQWNPNGKRTRSEPWERQISLDWRQGNPFKARIEVENCYIPDETCREIVSKDP